MSTRWESFPIKFEGGLITNLGRIEQGVQAPGSATILQNFEADVQGGYSRILGYFHCLCSGNRTDFRCVGS
jgi:hypothetical protein